MKTAIARFIEEIERAFHRRAFGEERARVNLLPAEQPRTYLDRVRRRGAGAGRPLAFKRTKASPWSGLPVGNAPEVPSVRSGRRGR